MKNFKIFDFLRTAIGFTANLRTTGALFQTSKKTEIDIFNLTKSLNPKVIVEYGAGHGNITKAILRATNSEAKIYSFEINADFCEVLRKIVDDRLIVINDSAENLNQHISNPVDLIVSTIPFSLIPKKELDSILKISSQKLSSQGIMCQVLYSRYYIKKLRTYFKEVKCKTLITIPFEFVHYCSNKAYL